MRSSGLVRIALVALALCGTVLAVRSAAPTPPAPPPVAPPDDGILTGQVQRGQQGFDPREMLRRRRRGTLQQPAGPHEFYFTRAIYNSGWGWSRWATDYPKADRQFMTVVNRLIDIDGSPYENAVRLDDPRIRDFPFLYALEVGDIALSEAENRGAFGTTCSPAASW